MINLTAPKRSSDFFNRLTVHKTAIIYAVAIVAALLIVFPSISGQIFPLIVVTSGSLVCLWLYSLESPTVDFG